MFVALTHVQQMNIAFDLNALHILQHGKDLLSLFGDQPLLCLLS